MDNDQLKHYGVRGMRWGVRRYQNKDGSYTPAGKKRERKEKTMSDEELTSQVRRLALEKQYSKLSKADAKPTRTEKAKNAVDSAAALVNQAKKLDRDLSSAKKKERLDLDAMTDKELRDKINRELLERQYNDIFYQEQVSRGREYVRATLDVAGPVLAIAGSALGIAVSLKTLKG